MNNMGKMATQRLHKVLAQKGLGSLRTVEKWIQEGRVKVNGKVAVLGQRVTICDSVTVEGRRVRHSHLEQSPRRVLLYHKPEGEICSHREREGEQSVYAALPKLKQGKWISIGRLDVNTSGLLLFTNDGGFAHQLMHPRFQVERKYIVRVLGEVTEAALCNLKKGIKIGTDILGFKEIIPMDVASKSANKWFTVVLTEGKYREIRRLWETQGCRVSRLTRIQYGPVALPRWLRKGHWHALSQVEIERFFPSQ